MTCAVAAALAAACLVAAVRCEEVLVKLEGGSSANEGTIFVKRGSDWGLVCDDDWDLRDGAVICRQLGYKKLVRTTMYNHFKTSVRSLKILLDDVMCLGFEENIGECRHRGWGISNCNAGEAAGVICSKEPLGGTGEQLMATPASNASGSTNVEPTVAGSSAPVSSSSTRGQQVRLAPPTTATKTTKLATTRATTSGSTNQQLVPKASPPNAAAPAFRAAEPSASAQTAASMNAAHSGALGVIHDLMFDSRHLQFGVEVTQLKLVGGRFSQEGYVRLTLADGRTGSLCADNWGIFEAMVACRQAGHTYAKQATNADFFGGGSETKLFYEVDCDGHEASLSDCAFRELGAGGVKCSKPQSIAGVVCTKAALPDLVPNIGALLASTFVQDVPLQQLECAMEERCLSSSAYTQHATSFGRGGEHHYLFGGLQSYFGGWTLTTRRLLRFASSIMNNGTADFRPVQHRSAWEWHACHMHWHSMNTFTHYDVVDQKGNRVAEGHKASFCLEDVECRPGVRAKYSCRGFGEQGISVGCADVYKQDIDCQWIDITDLKPGTYVFKLVVNPEYKVSELSFDNNAVTCEMTYSGYGVRLRDCTLGRG